MVDFFYKGVDFLFLSGGGIGQDKGCFDILSAVKRRGLRHNLIKNARDV